MAVGQLVPLICQFTAAVAALSPVVNEARKLVGEKSL